MKYFLTLLLAALVVAAAVTNPDESKHKKALTERHGPLFGLGAALGQMMGATQFEYHNYGVISQETMTGPDGKTEVLSTGCFGQIWFADHQDPSHR